MNRNQHFIDFQNQMFMDYINLNPSNVKGQFNLATQRNKRYLYNLIYSVFDLEIPDNWNMSYFRYFVFHYGNLGVFYTNKFGWVPMPFTMETMDFFFFPKKIIGNNPMIKPVIGIREINAEIIYIFDDLFGLEQTVNEYAQKLANVDKAFDVNLMNSSFALTAFVEDEKEAMEIKAAYGRASMGEPFLPVKKRLKEAMPKELVPNAKNNLAASELHQARRNVINDFLTEIGVRNANYDKRERLNSQEVSENNDETKAQAQIMLDNLTKCFERVRKVTGGAIDLKVSLNYNYEILGEDSADNEEEGV